jgi:hypothetical protein
MTASNNPNEITPVSLERLPRLEGQRHFFDVIQILHQQGLEVLVAFSHVQGVAPIRVMVYKGPSWPTSEGEVDSFFVEAKFLDDAIQELMVQGLYHVNNARIRQAFHAFLKSPYKPILFRKPRPQDSHKIDEPES